MSEELIQIKTRKAPSITNNAGIFTATYLSLGLGFSTISALFLATVIAVNFRRTSSDIWEQFGTTGLVINSISAILAYALPVIINYYTVEKISKTAASARGQAALLLFLGSFLPNLAICVTLLLLSKTDHAYLSLLSIPSGCVLIQLRTVIRIAREQRALALTESKKKLLEKDLNAPTHTTLAKSE